MKKFLLSTILLVFCSTLTFGQEKTMEIRAEKEAEKINANIISANPSAALSEKQVKQIIAIYVEKFKGMEDLKKSNVSEEEIAKKRKELNLKCNQRVFREVFTAEQKIANKEGREKNKG